MGRLLAVFATVSCLYGISALVRVAIAFPDLRPVAFAALFIGALLLVPFPMLVVANIMSIAGNGEPGAPAPWVLRVFLWGTLAYPIVYFLSFELSMLPIPSEGAGLAPIVGAAPLLYLLAVSGPALVVGFVQGKGHAP